MYEPTVWNSGDIITAEKLNKLENGVDDSIGVIVLSVDDSTQQLVPTFLGELLKFHLYSLPYLSLFVLSI